MVQTRQAICYMGAKGLEKKHFVNKNSMVDRMHEKHWQPSVETHVHPLILKGHRTDVCT
jgi:hypothetical protein